MDQHSRARLRWLAQHSENYRAFADSDWLKATTKLVNRRNLASRSLHDQLALLIFSYRDDPVKAYHEAQLALEQSAFLSDKDFDPLPSITLPVPFIKPRDSLTADRVEYSNFAFDKRRLPLLIGNQFTIVVGGSPNSGKSTFTASLGLAMQHIVTEAVRDGVLGPGDIKIGLCDLDLASPTLEYILGGMEVPRGKKRQWNASLLQKALEDLRLMQASNTIVIGDLPGGAPPHGTPNYVTLELAKAANFSIQVDRTYPEESQPWHQFLLGAHLPHRIIRTHSRMEERRVSGALEYKSRARDGKKEFIKGQIVDLKRAPRPKDPFVELAAHALLFDFLPQEVYMRHKVAWDILNALGLGQTPKN